MTMPPSPLVFRGRGEIGDFFSTVPLGGALDQIRLVPTRANRRPALAAYALDPDAGAYVGYGIMVFEIGGDEIVEITGCADPALFPLFDLPSALSSVPS